MCRGQAGTAEEGDEHGNALFELVATELHKLAQSYGDHIEESGSVAPTLHRGWMSLKDALAGSSPDGVLDAAEQGEDHAIKEYDKALDSDFSANCGRWSSVRAWR